MMEKAKNIVYIVQHIHEFVDGSEDVKLIGAFSTPETAQQAVDQLRHVEGFKDIPEGFSIDAYELDILHWTEGYMTYTYPRQG